MKIKATHESVKRLFWQAIRRGESKDCPTCGQFVKVYHRTINANMGQTLIQMYKHAGANPVHTPSLPGDTHEASQLSWWGLIEDEGKVRPDGGRAGWWKLTEKGVAFVLGRTTVPKHAWVLDGQCEGLDDDEVITIHDSLGQKFNYNELMSDRKIRLVSNG